MATKIEKEILLGKIKGDMRTVNFTQMIHDQQQFVRNAQKLAGSKPSKVEDAYIAEQKAKLAQLEDIVKQWIWEAYPDDEEIAKKTMYWGELVCNFEIEVLVKIR
jgi:hypothetical protein